MADLKSSAGRLVDAIAAQESQIGEERALAAQTARVLRRQRQKARAHAQQLEAAAAAQAARLPELEAELDAARQAQAPALSEIETLKQALAEAKAANDALRAEAGAAPSRDEIAEAVAALEA